jgi:PTS system cellobiose-specific IIB component
MKVLLVCAAGMSTSIIMQKMEKYASENGIALGIAAIGIFEYGDVCSSFDVIFLGPQISYKKDEIAKKSNKPVIVLGPLDYAIGNAEAIFKQIQNVQSDQNTKYQDA